MVVELGQ
jgi:hypothetical protein